MAFVMAQDLHHQNLGVEDDTMEISSDAGRMDDVEIDIELGDEGPSDPFDDPMGYDDQGDPHDDDMHDDSENNEFREEDMAEDLIDDGDEELSDIREDNTEVPSQIDFHTSQTSHQSPESDVQENRTLPKSPNIASHHDDDLTTDSQVPQMQGEDFINAEVQDGSGKNFAQNNQGQLDDHATTDRKADAPTIQAEEAVSTPPPNVEEAPHDLAAEEEEKEERESHESESGAAKPVNEAAPSTSPELHPIVVTWDGSEMSLFQDEAFAQFLIQDSSVAHSSLATLFSECRKVLSDSVNDSLELVFDIPQLELRIREDVVNASTCSIADVVDIYVNLSVNDGVEHPEALRLILTSRTTFEARINELREASTSGQGLGHIETYRSDDENEEENEGEEAGAEEETGAEQDYEENPEAGNVETEQVETGEAQRDDQDQPAEIQPIDRADDIDEEEEEGETGDVDDEAPSEEAVLPTESETARLTDARNEQSEESTGSSGNIDRQELNEVADDVNGGANVDEETSSSGSSTAEVESHPPPEEAESENFHDEAAGEELDGHDAHVVDGTAEDEAEEEYEIDYSEDDAEEEPTEGQGSTAADQVDDEGDAAVVGEASFAEGSSQYVDAPESANGEVTESGYTANAQDPDDEFINYPFPDEAADEADGEIETVGDEEGQQAQDPNSSAHKSLARKRSFSEHGDGDEITDGSETKKSRPA